MEGLGLKVVLERGSGMEGTISREVGFQTY